ncbi:transposase [Candidatus Midichloria mitochondrii]|uniref:transposase n=1 Tax=Candidatus Midichloria mitochondrii TaxID=234827 RepID=UPI002A4E18DE|nr:transposase [Candidatus Midichloria mitochondrii]
MLKGIAQRGKTSTRWFFGLNDQGEIMSFTLTSGNTDDRAVVEKLTQYLTGLLFGDRWYISKH